MSIFDGMDLDLTLAGQTESQPSIWDMQNLPTVMGNGGGLMEEEEDEIPKPPNQWIKDVSGFANYGMEAPAIPQMPGISSIPDASKPGGIMNFPEHSNQSQIQGMPGAPNYAQAPQLPQMQQQPQQMRPQQLPMQQQMPSIQDQSMPQQLGDPMQRIQGLMAYLKSMGG